LADARSPLAAARRARRCLPLTRALRPQSHVLTDPKLAFIEELVLLAER
jgi:hypothetical protein